MAVEIRFAFRLSDRALLIGKLLPDPILAGKLSGD